MLNTISAKESARAQALGEWLLAWKIHKTNWFIWIMVQEKQYNSGPETLNLPEF